MKIIAKPYTTIGKDGTDCFESIIILKEDDSYPYAIVPIDFFWDHQDRNEPRGIYNRLHRQGQTIAFELKEIK